MSSRGRIVFQKFLTETELCDIFKSLASGPFSNMTKEFDVLYFSDIDKEPGVIRNFFSKEPFPWNPVVSGYIVDDQGKYFLKNGEWVHYPKRYLQEYSDKELLDECKRRKLSGMDEEEKKEKDPDKDVLEMKRTVILIQECIKAIKECRDPAVRQFRLFLMDWQKEFLVKLAKK